MISTNSISRFACILLTVSWSEFLFGSPQSPSITEVRNTSVSPNADSSNAHDEAEDSELKLYDLVLQGGRVVDGTGAPWYMADVGIRGNKIAKIGSIDAGQASRLIDATGLIVAPGFIDMMGQSASPMLDSPSTAMNLLSQGITTINAGEGVSAAPLSSDDGKRKGWNTMAEYFALLDIQGLPINLAQTVGHTQVRRMVLGGVDRRPGPTELEQMQVLVREAMEAGAIGVSTSLIYPPAVYAQTEEIAALVKTAGEYGGRYYTHMRNEGDHLLEAIDEALDIGRIGKTPVHIFHLKTAGQQNWGKMPLAIAKIKAAQASGQQITADVYPYINNGLEIGAFIHPKHFADGKEAFLGKLRDSAFRNEIRVEMETTRGWENWFRNVNYDWDRVVVGQTKERRYEDQVGQSIAKMALAHKEDPWDTFFALVSAGAFALPQSMSEANKILAIQQDFVSFCTDVGPDNGSLSASHPRAYGSFPRLFSRYVRDLGIVTLERAVAQASSLAANEVFAYDRGRIAEGLVADIVLFDFSKLTDHATFTNPKALSQGIQYVIVNGTLVLEEGKYTGKRPGRVLRGPGFRPRLAPSTVTTGQRVPAFTEFEKLIREFMAEHRIPGAAIAVAKEGKVMYSRGFGYADIATREQVQPTSLFRIASISKPITAVAILQLVEQGKLRLEDPVFSVLDFEDEIQKAGDAFDPRLRQITIEHLLQHRGGWDRGKSFDAMFQSVRFATQMNVSPPAGPVDVIRAMLYQKLDFEPGEQYAYSNFGYCLLGRVIERLSNQSYEKQVQSKILEPIGVHSMRLGASRFDGRASGEVRYYHPGTTLSVFQADLGEPVASPYGGWNLEAMDAHGGWIASAEDLARFAMSFDEPDRSPILTKQSIEQMHRRPAGLAGYNEDGSPKETYYSLGWQNRILKNDRINHWHTGSLGGTATILIRRNDGVSLVALFNSRTSPTADHLGKEIDLLLGKAMQKVTLPKN